MTPLMRWAAIISVLIIVYLAVYLQSGDSQACVSHKPDFENTVDGEIVPCPEGCALGSCEGLQTACCPFG